ncbi:FUSC family protein [Rosenbergiella australiborealis]|uniref:FUSC family protein n=1 Tax=Rosenbergiella australiborealis TaxID=1544696 RepID=UPI001F4EE84E|nr:FUSC family protein [Rosenbergiella australiborealis]
MSLQWLAWENLPWVRASQPQWRYALRNTLAMCLALSFAYSLDLDEPYWAMTSAAVVSFPTIGGAISKSLGRIIGSLVGAAAAVLIAGYTLNDPWLFTFAFASWLAFCTWIANLHQNNVAYAFSLAGYTAALIAFSTVNITDINQLWDIAQARVCEAITGILCAGFMMMLLPSTSDGDALMKTLHQMHARLLEHARLLLNKETADNAHTAHETMIGEILTTNLLRIQAYWSHYRYRRQNSVLNYVLHQQLRLTGILSGLRRMLLNWPEAPDELYRVIDALFSALEQPNCHKYQLAKLLSTVTPTASGNYRQLAFVNRLRYFCWVYVDVQRWIRLLDNAEHEQRLHPPKVPALALESDRAEALLSAGRTFFAIVLGSSFQIYTQWDQGPAALTLTAIACVLYSSAPSPSASVTLLLKTLLILCVISFVMKFGIMIQITQLWQFLIVLFPIIITLQLFKLLLPKRAPLWGQIVVFMGSFISVSNPPTWDYGSVLNGDIAKVCGVIFAWLAFVLIRPSSDDRKSLRHIRALRRGFLDQLRSRPRSSQNNYESSLYYHINQLKSSQNHQAKLWLLRWGVVLQNSAHIVWELRSWQSGSEQLMGKRDRCFDILHTIISERGVLTSQLNAVLRELAEQSNDLSHSQQPDSIRLAGLLWRLHCSLAQLGHSVPPTHSK